MQTDFLLVACPLSTLRYIYKLGHLDPTHTASLFQHLLDVHVRKGMRESKEKRRRIPSFSKASVSSENPIVESSSCTVQWCPPTSHLCCLQNKHRIQCKEGISPCFAHSRCFSSLCWIDMYFVEFFLFEIVYETVFIGIQPQAYHILTKYMGI